MRTQARAVCFELSRIWDEIEEDQRRTEWEEEGVNMAMEEDAGDTQYAQPICAVDHYAPTDYAR